jgi:DNA-binding IclR family transcriptional regulator
MRATPLNRKPLAPSTDRCLAILEVLSQHPEGLTLSEIHHLLGVSKNMIFRILGDMRARGYVEPDAHKSYSLGGKLLELAAPRVNGRNLVDEAAPIVRQLRDECRESVGLLVPNGGQAVLIYFQPALYPMRMTFDLGFRVDLYCNAPGKVFLAFGDSQQRRQRLNLQTLRARTPRTITDPVRLAAELELARQSGYTVDRGEDLEGAHCVAAPVFDGDRRLIAAIVIAGVSHRMSEDVLPTMGAQVAAAAGRLSERLTNM